MAATLHEGTYSLRDIIGYVNFGSAIEATRPENPNYMLVVKLWEAREEITALAALHEKHGPKLSKLYRLISEHPAELGVCGATNYIGDLPRRLGMPENEVDLLFDELQMYQITHFDINALQVRLNDNLKHPEVEKVIFGAKEFKEQAAH